MSITIAFKEWKKIEGVIAIPQKDAAKKFNLNTIGATRRIKGALMVTKVSQIQEIVIIANTYRVSLYPISGGHNWGYGSGLPASNDCVILDLSEMKRIIEFNKELGYVTLEAGVTQQQLFEYMRDHDCNFMVPTTGAGPSCSIIGNALEKGYGITPHEDHFGAVLTLKAVLANGDIYHSAISQFGGHRSDQLFKWKFGPYLDGLFTQGNAGIVVQATVALAPKPEQITQFLLFVEEAHFQDAVKHVAKIKQKFGSMVGGINMMNKYRLLAMLEAKQEWAGQDTLTELHIRELARKRKLPDWAVMGGIYCPNELQGDIVSVIKKEFKKTAKHMVFLNRKKVNFYKKVLKFLPFKKLQRTVQGVSQGLDLLEGIPGTVALPLAYLKNRHKLPARDKLSPDEDGCGLIWYSPLVPIDSSFVRDYTQEITRVCLSQGIEPLITLTTLSERCFDSTVPILFDLDNVAEIKKAKTCYKLLLELSKEMGVYPYRTDIDSMRQMYDTAEGSSFDMLEKINDALDPNHIISPGRYHRIRKT
jgi:4-cresol dehydrogenase (hydroxylating)